MSFTVFVKLRISYFKVALRKLLKQRNNDRQQVPAPWVQTPRLSHAGKITRPRDNQVAPTKDRREERLGISRHRTHQGPAGPEVVWSRASEALSHEGADHKLNAMANGEPMNGVWIW